MKAKAAVFMGVLKDFEVREFEVTECPRGYGQMELIASGICGTDLHFHNGKLAIQPPTVIGHEFVGKITDLDESEAAKYAENTFFISSASAIAIHSFEECIAS